MGAFSGAEGSRVLLEHLPLLPPSQALVRTGEEVGGQGAAGRRESKGMPSKRRKKSKCRRRRKLKRSNVNRQQTQTMRNENEMQDYRV